MMPAMLWRTLWRLGPLVIPMLVLWVVVAQGAAGFLAWVAAPVFSAGGILVFREWLFKRYRSNPEYAYVVFGKVALLLPLFLGATWFARYLPFTTASLKNLFTFTDVSTSVDLDPCLASVQAVVRTFATEIETEQAKQIEAELAEIVADVRAGRASGDDVAKRRAAVLLKIGSMAQGRRELQSTLALCEPGKMSTPSSTPVLQPEAEAATPREPLPGAARPAVPPAVVASGPDREPSVRRPTYVTNELIDGTLAVFAPSTEPLIEARVTEAASAKSGIFTAAFFADGYFDRAFSGDVDTLVELRLSRATRLLACRSSVAPTRPQGLDPDLRGAAVIITCRQLDAASRTSRLIVANGTGVGFNDTDAVGLGTSRAVDSLVSQIQGR